MGKLTIGSGFSLPPEAVTQTFAILAKRGAGKTYTALVLVEECLKASLPVCVVDPVGVTWGLRAAADGKGPGLPIVVMGGDHGDVPLEGAAGVVVADFLVEERRSVVLDLSLFRKAEQVRFMTEFAERLYHRNRAPLHVLLDEADAFAPQRPLHGQERMLGAIEDLVRRGRARGLGLTLVTQRAAVLNKDVLTQVEVLVCLRTIAPQDREAIDAWIKVHGTPAQREELMASLPSLPIGTAWFWSPGWLDVFRKVEVRRRETYDSSATPKAGELTRGPKQLAAVDLEALKARMAATIEKAKAEDPRELRRRIQELEAEIRKLKAQPAPKADVQVKAVPGLKEADFKRLEAALIKLDAVQERESKLQFAVSSSIGVLREALYQVRTSGAAPAHRAPTSRPVPPVPPRVGTREDRPAGMALPGPEQRILDAVAWLEAIGITEPAQAAVAFLAGYTVGGGAFNNPRGALRTKGLIRYVGDRLALTDAGRQQARCPETPLTAEELHRRVLDRLPGPERKLLTTLLEAYPQSVSNEELATRAGYQPGGGAFNNPRGRLRTLGLIDYPERGQVRASSLLFLER